MIIIKDYVKVISDGEIDLIQQRSFYEDKDDFWYEIALHDIDIIVGEISYEDRPKDTEYFGTISYEIYKQFRGHNYSKKALNLLKELLKEAGKKEMIISINPYNIISQKVAEGFGAKLLCTRKIPESHILYFDNDLHEMKIYKYSLEDKNEKNKT